MLNMQEPSGAEPNHDVLILGTGALATLFAARLARAGHEITLLGSWQPGLHSLRVQGARLVDTHGNEQAFPVRVVEDPEECHGARQAIVLVKSWQTERAAMQLATCLADDGLAISLQNGLGNYEYLKARLSEERG
jgi:2-dehydropantoate 2-reductase